MELFMFFEYFQPDRKFSTYIKSLVIELDEELYGPDFHLVEWHKETFLQESDGFQVCLYI